MPASTGDHRTSTGRSSQLCRQPSLGKTTTGSPAQLQISINANQSYITYVTLFMSYVRRPGRSWCARPATIGPGAAEHRPVSVTVYCHAVPIYISHSRTHQIAFTPHTGSPDPQTRRTGTRQYTPNETTRTRHLCRETQEYNPQTRGPSHRPARRKSMDLPATFRGDQCHDRRTSSDEAVRAAPSNSLCEFSVSRAGRGAVGGSRVRFR